MIISRTPFRISFFGGGTDYPDWYREHGGAVLSTTINKYCYISCRNLPPFFEHKHRIVYSQIETVREINEIRHPAARAVLNHMKINNGLEIHHDGDLPARSGLGSSSSFTVGLINTIKALNGEIISKKDLSQLAIHIEQDVIKETVGSQDQIAAAYGGLNQIEFKQDDTYVVNPVIMPKERSEEFQRHLMLFFTGFARNAPQIAKTKIENFGKRKEELMAMRGLVGEASSILQSRNTSFLEIGKLLDESWKIKRSLSSSISSSTIDEIYRAGLEGGATGGKLLGAGGGGFMLFFVKPELQSRVRYKLKNLLHVSFNFEWSGSKIVFYDPQLS